MARVSILVALLSASFALLVITQLLATFGAPQTDFWNWRVWQIGSFERHGQAVLDTEGNGDGSGSAADGDQYLLGVGKADITGPVVEINLMGYADPDQVGTGLRQRLFSRAFVVGDASKPEDRFVYLVLDTQSGDTAIRSGILDGLAALGPEYEVYGQQNVAVTGTHSHSGPGAWLNYLLPQITSKGFSKQSYQAIVDGALLSIQRAHESLAPGFLSIGTKDLYDANINRSPYAYLANPREERDRYDDDVDKAMTLLKFTRAADKKDIGVLTWFAVHGTSMLGNNTLISGDNKGVAAHLFEQHMVHNNPNAAPGFVAGFSQSNVGDTSPNTLGAYCEDGSGTECAFEDSTCGGRNEPCHGRGPFFREKDEGAKSCFEIGRRQFEGAKDIYYSLADAPNPVHGPTVKSLHVFRDLSNYTFPHPNGTLVHTCPAALGYSFAAGTTDGPGAFDFKQNNSQTPNANPLWAVVGGFLHEPSDAQRACHWPKPILLDVGEATKPYAWTPNIVDIQLFRVGRLVIIVSPGEATTMAGRRWREAIRARSDELALSGGAAEHALVVLGGPANSYTHYIATEEEYAIQRYEGASTLYGPHTLNAYINLTLSYLPHLHRDATGAPGKGPEPPVNVNNSLSFIRGVVFDRAPFLRDFGDVVVDVEAAYAVGDVVSATFVGANPRNNLRLEGSFVRVEKRGEDGGWTPWRDDGDWNLVYRWRRTSGVLGTSEVDVTWETEMEREEREVEGWYRVRYWGDAKMVGSGEIVAFEGLSGEFLLSR